MPITLPLTVATARSPVQKSFQLTPGRLTTWVRLTTCGICATLGAHEPYRYAMSGGLPPRTAVSTFCSVLSLLTYRVFTFWPGCVASYSETRCAKALASTWV